MNGHVRPGSEDNAEIPPVVTPEVAAEAAVWIARLHGPDRSKQMERECLEWQGRSAANRLAFERCTETWEDVARLTVSDAFAGAAALHRSNRGQGGVVSRAGPPRWLSALAVCAFIAIGAAAVQYWRVAGSYSTGVGEQQVVILEDGSRLSLNTSSRVRAEMTAKERRVHVLQGEVLFEVAKDPLRSFVVLVDETEVVAHGTVFLVRIEPGQARASDALSVTLIEGKVTLQSTAKTPEGLASTWALAMKPGERVRRVGPAPGSTDGGTVRVDEPRIDTVVAWKRDEAVFNDTSLADAVAELNRYNRTQIVLVGDSSIGNLRVSGVYRTGDTAGFARAVAALHGLALHERDGRLELAAAQ